MSTTVPEDAWKAAVHFTKHPLGFVNTDNEFMWVNNAFEELVGYSVAELRDKTWMDITLQEDVGGDLASVRSVLDGQVSEYAMAKRYRHKFGHVIPVMLSVLRFPPSIQTGVLCFIVEAAPRPALTVEVDELRAKFDGIVSAMQTRIQLMEEKQRSGNTTVSVGSATGVESGNTTNSTTAIYVLAASVCVVSMVLAWIAYYVFGHPQHKAPPEPVSISRPATE